MRRWTIFGLFGLLFGFVLSRSGATSYDRITGMFLLSDLHIMGVIGVAVATAGIGLAWQRHRRGGVALIQPKPKRPGSGYGAAIFGAGWALTGTCPGTGFAQIGEGKLLALFTVGGMLLGAALYQRARWSSQTPQPLTTSMVRPSGRSISPVNVP